MVQIRASIEELGEQHVNTQGTYYGNQSQPGAPPALKSWQGPDGSHVLLRYKILDGSMLDSQKLVGSEPRADDTILDILLIITCPLNNFRNRP